jgi:hypothetical protein
LVKRKWDKLLTRYADGPAQLQAAIARLNEPELDAAADAESWTIRQIVHHIVDGDDIFKLCIKMALGKGQPAFDLQWYWDMPQTRWAELWAYGERAIGPSLALFSANRCHTVELSQKIPDAWERSIVIRGTIVEEHRSMEERVTVAQVIEQGCDHLEGHIEDIRKIRQAVHPQQSLPLGH